MLELSAVRMNFPADANIIVGQSYFVKTTEDLYEAIVTASAAGQVRSGLQRVGRVFDPLREQ